MQESKSLTFFVEILILTKEIWLVWHVPVLWNIRATVLQTLQENVPGGPIKQLTLGDTLYFNSFDVIINVPTEIVKWMGIRSTLISCLIMSRYER